MNHKCDKCDRQAVHYSVDVASDGQKIEKYLCTEHALEDPEIMDHSPEMPTIPELLTSFVKAHSGSAAEQELTCEHCGLSYSDFRERSLLGCSQCYESFEPILGPLLERAHEGGARHLGKVPRRCGADDHRQNQLIRLRQRLDEAVAAEDYELAADLRDEIGQCEGSTSS